MRPESGRHERPSERAEDRQRSLLAADVGPHRLVFDLRTLLAIERRDSRVEHAAILGPVDVRSYLGLAPGDIAGDSVLVPTEEAVYRLVFDRLSELVQSDLRRLFPMPAVLHPLTEPLALRGVVALEDGLGFLVDPGRLALNAWRAQGEVAA